MRVLLEFLSSIFRQCVIVFVAALVCCAILLSVVLMRVESVALTSAGGKNLIAFIAEIQKPAGCLWAGLLVDAEKERECFAKRVESEENLRQLKEKKKSLEDKLQKLSSIPPNLVLNQAEIHSRHEQDNFIGDFLLLLVGAVFLLAFIFLFFRKFLINFKKKVGFSWEK